MAVEVPIKDKINLTVEEASAYSNVGICTIRALLADPRCPFALRVGRKVLVKRKQFENFMEHQNEV